MRRRLLWALTLCGIGLITCGIGALFTGSRVARAQENTDLQDAEYVGAQECGDCHRALSRAHDDSPHGRTLQDVSRDEDLILGDFSQGEDVRLVQFPGDDAPRPFEADDIAFAVGSGRNIQRYLYEIDRNEFIVLPAQWNVNTQSWERYTLVGEWPDDAYNFGQNCAGCHTTGLDTRRFRWEDDAVQCEACHGPGSVHLDVVDEVGRNPDEEGMQQIRASIVLSPDAQICGQCHSQGTEPENGLPFPAAYRPGTELLNEDVFTLVAPDDTAHWYSTGHARQKYMQFNESLLSAHSTSLETMLKSKSAGAGCLQCHSGDFSWTERLTALADDGELGGIAPDPVTLDAAKWSITCVNCHDPHNNSGDQPDHLTTDSYTLCTSCHTNPPDSDSPHHPVREMFEGISLVSDVEGVPGAHFSAADGPRCTTCHMPDVPVENSGTRASHLLKPIIPGKTEDEPPDACSKCHENLTVTDLRSLVEDTQNRVRDRLRLAFARLSSVSEPDTGAATRELYDHVVNALNFVQNDGSMGVHNYDYANALLKSAEQGLTELSMSGAAIVPTEGPAPTATPSEPVTVIVTTGGQTASTGLRPITVILMGMIVLILLVSAFLFFGRSGSQEVKP